MPVKPAVQSEFVPFIDAEIKSVSDKKGGFVNTSPAKWEIGVSGPEKEHEHTRTQLNTEVKASVGGPSRGMGKIAADFIAVHERAFNLRTMSRRQAYVKKYMNSEAKEAAYDMLKNSVNTQVTY